jgi:inner membrane protein
VDSVTHIVVGACVGELVGGKQLGKKALLIGAVANSLPDIDIVASFFLPLTADLLAHRGFTHSLLFLALVTPLLSYLSARLFPTAAMSRWRWMYLWGLQIFLHIFIDGFNAYGTGWFEPFSHYRVSFNTMFVADPLFTLWPLVAAIALLVLKTKSRGRTKWAGIALVLSAAYLITGIVNKNTVDRQIKQELASRNISHQDYFSTPTPLNSILWYVVAKSDSGFYIGYRSLFDKHPTTRLRYACQNNYLLEQAKNKEDIARLVRFSQGFYTATTAHDTLLFNDLRFGEIAGWADSTPHCVFYYYPELTGANDLVVQRGRFANWDAQAVITFINRIRGK